MTCGHTVHQRVSLQIFGANVFELVWDLPHVLVLTFLGSKQFIGLREALRRQAMADNSSNVAPAVGNP